MARKRFFPFRITPDPSGSERMRLRSSRSGAVDEGMRFGGQYVLGIDCLPRGVYAAIAVGKDITATFEVVSPNGRALPIQERARAAIAEAVSMFGAEPAEVRLVCVDDGGEGAEIEDTQDWLEAQRIKALVLDLVGPVEVVDHERELAEALEWVASDRTEADADVIRADALSMARACEAALW